MSLREWLKPVLLEEIKHAHTVQFGDETWVIPEIKVLFEVYAFASTVSATQVIHVRTHLRLLGSCFLSVSNTRISILLASRYF